MQALHDGSNRDRWQNRNQVLRLISDWKIFSLGKIRELEIEQTKAMLKISIS